MRVVLSEWIVGQRHATWVRTPAIEPCYEQVNKANQHVIRIVAKGDMRGDLICAGIYLLVFGTCIAASAPQWQEFKSLTTAVGQAVGHVLMRTVICLAEMKAVTRTSETATWTLAIKVSRACVMSESFIARI